MAVYKDNNGTWYISVRYVNWKGEHARRVIFQKNGVLDIVHNQISIPFNSSVPRFSSLLIKCCKHRGTVATGKN